MTAIFLQGDVRVVLKGMPENFFQCVVTSPPYWGLRKYSGEQDLIWGEPSSDNPCRHEWDIKKITVQNNNDLQGSTLTSGAGDEKRQAWHDGKSGSIERGFCSICGAWRGAYGLEPDPSLYVQHTIEILREIRRVLRKDGVVFWNIGDSYAANRSYQVTDTKWRDVGNTKGSQVPGGLKPKDLCLIPFRVAIAAQEDGWWVRSDIIWSKPNPMPESVTDRPTNSHEYILMLTKSAKYYWDANAVREQATRDWGNVGGSILNDTGWMRSAVNDDGHKRNIQVDTTGRNLRSVWTFPTQPYPEAYFAVFPEKLPERCIKAATPEVGCCSKCGAPWGRVIEKSQSGNNQPHSKEKYASGSEFLSDKTSLRLEQKTTTLGWQPTCSCNADKVPSIVLDPFAGAGTTSLVCECLGRDSIGVDTSDDYIKMARQRLADDAVKREVSK